jgi:predicted KAP-like P-loop ATPase
MILFLVDELDRCRSDYAISYLQTIKHIFDIKAAVFLLAADRKHLDL